MPDMSVIYSVIIPAFNEEKFLPRTLQHLQKALDKIEEHAEVIVVDNNSDDRTAEIAHEYGAQVVFEPLNQISRARNAGARAATGKYLIFLDADTMLSEILIRTALANLHSGLCCGGGAEVHFEREVPRLPQRVLDFWNWYSRKRSIAAGCFIYCLREGFEAVGGFSEAVYASEEIWFSIALKAWGKNHNMKFQVIMENPIITSVRKLDWYTTSRLFFYYLPIVIFPPLLRAKYFCSSWYRRPE